MKPAPRRPRRLSIQSLESRRLLASLSSQLPPIRAASPDDTVEIADGSGRAIEISTVAVQGIRELQQISDEVSGMIPSLQAMLPYLQEEAWQRVEAQVASDATAIPELDQAVEIAQLGFTVSRPPEGLFGPPLSSQPFERSLITELSRPDAIILPNQTDVVPDAAILVNLDASVIAGSSERTVAEVEPDEANESERRSGDSTAAEPLEPEDDRPADSLPVNEPEAGTEYVAPREAGSEVSSNGGMIILDLVPRRDDEHSSRPLFQQHSQTSREIVRESRPRFESRSTDADALQEMIMLPANLWVDVQSRIDGDADPRLRVAGMNPFTLIQLFVGGPEEADGGPIQWLAPVDSTSMLDQSDASLAIANSQRWSLSAVTVLVAASYLYQRRIHRTNRETGESRFVLSR